MVNTNPIMQFARKAQTQAPAYLSQQFSPTGQGAGLGQELGGQVDEAHLRAVKRNDIFFNMMKFRMQARSV